MEIRTYTIHANDTFWGVFEGSTEEEAKQAAAEEHGTDGNTDGMLAAPIGQYVKLLAEGCRMNGRNINDFIREFFNCRDAEVDDDGDIWIADPQTGHWIDREKTADFIAWFES